MKNFTRIAIVEDNDSIREGFATVIDSISKYYIVGQFRTAEEAIESMALAKPDLVLMDIGLPGMDGIEAIKQLRRIVPKCLFIVITVHEDSELVFKALCAGAMGYITKHSGYVELLEAIDELLNGGSPMSSKIARMVISSFQTTVDSPLTKRELEVLQGLARGKSYSQIAKDLEISSQTSRSHIKNIYSKLHVTSKYEALEKARREKII